MDAIDSPPIVSLDSYVVTSLARFSAILWSYCKFMRSKQNGGESKERVTMQSIYEWLEEKVESWYLRFWWRTAWRQQKQTYRQGLDSMAHNNANSRRRWLSETELAATLTKMEVCLGHVHCMTDDDLISVSSRF